MDQRTRAREGFSRGFSLVELLVVIGIIALLVGILIPVVSKVRISGYIADSKNLISQISGAIERYHTEFKAYPGPISNANIAFTGAPAITVPTTTGFATAPFGVGTITMSENLTLGLLGGLNIGATGIIYNPSQVGLGPMNLNAANPKRYSAFIEASNLSWYNDTPTTKSGQFKDDIATANDTIIPEFVDRFPTPMPILYMRSKLGVDTISTGATATNNSVVTNDAARAGAYDLSQINGYTANNIGIGKELKSSDYKNAMYPEHGLKTVNVARTLDKTDQYPYDAYPYFQGGNQAGVPRQKDGYILIFPGRDRVYGTSDDICNFGDVNP